MAENLPRRKNKNISPRKCIKSDLNNETSVTSAVFITASGENLKQDNDKLNGCLHILLNICIMPVIYVWEQNIVGLFTVPNLLSQYLRNNDENEMIVEDASSNHNEFLVYMCNSRPRILPKDLDSNSLIFSQLNTWIMKTRNRIPSVHIREFDNPSVHCTVKPVSLNSKRKGHKTKCQRVCKGTNEDVLSYRDRDRLPDNHFAKHQYNVVLANPFTAVQPSENSENTPTPMVFSNGYVTENSNVLDSRNGQHASMRSPLANSLPDTSQNYNNHQAMHFLGNDSPVARQPKPPRYQQYTDQRTRLSTYERWCRQLPSPSVLSNAGFFFTGNAGLVRCFQCGIGLKDFSNQDDPLREHVKHSGNCEFLVELLGPSRLAEFKNKLHREDPELNRQRQWQQVQMNQEFPVTSNAVNHRHPEYALYDTRLSTFSKWPQHLVQRPEQLADAGLYYTGIDDHVRCFSCDGGLRRWDPEDNPWIEHCRWFPACPYARITKGHDFIALVQASVDTDVSTGEVYDSYPSQSSRPGLRNEPEMSHRLSRLDISRDVVEREIERNRTLCTQELGFSNEEFNTAISELRRRGDTNPSTEAIVDVIECLAKGFIHYNGTPNTDSQESLLEENKRLKSVLLCCKCTRNTVNALFLPCTHHKMCIDCAGEVTHCPLCNKLIRQKIKTFMS